MGAGIVQWGIRAFQQTPDLQKKPPLAVENHALSELVVTQRSSSSVKHNEMMILTGSSLQAKPLTRHDTV